MFKKNDFVRISTTEKIEEVLQFDGNFVYTESGYYNHKICELWQPKVGEWVIAVHKEEVGMFVVTKYSVDTMYNIRHTATVEPFIGKLPSYLKEIL